MSIRQCGLSKRTESDYIHFLQDYEIFIVIISILMVDTNQKIKTAKSYLSCSDKTPTW